MGIDEIGFAYIATATLLAFAIIERVVREFVNRRKRKDFQRHLWTKLGLDVDVHTAKKLPASAALILALVDNIATGIYLGTEMLISILSQFVSKPRKNKKVDTAPPKRAQKLLSYALKPSDIEVVLGDMNELYHAHAERHGYASARRWYTWQAIRSAFAQISGKLMKWGVFAYLHDLIHKIISQ